jgi:hypothetical protein
LSASSGSQQALPWRVGGSGAGELGGSPMNFFSNPT